MGTRLMNGCSQIRNYAEIASRFSHVFIIILFSSSFDTISCSDSDVICCMSFGPYSFFVLFSSRSYVCCPNHSLFSGQPRAALGGLPSDDKAPLVNKSCFRFSSAGPGAGLCGGPA